MLAVAWLSRWSPPGGNWVQVHVGSGLMVVPTAGMEAASGDGRSFAVVQDESYPVTLLLHSRAHACFRSLSLHVA